MAKEYNLTERQKRFADEYIISANVTQSAIKAGYTPKYADSQAYKLLGNVGIVNYLQERNKSIESDKVATMQEVREFWSTVLRDDESDLKDRIKVSELIGKANGEFLDRVENTGNVEIKVQWHE